MSALQYPISDTNPVRIAAGLQGALTLYNEDTNNTIYVSEYPNNNGFPISPGMTLSWDAAKALYAYVDANKPAMLDVVDNGGQISSPAAIANQLIASGLAAQIAADIKVSGAPPIDPLTTVASGSFQSTGIGSRLTPSYVVPSIDVGNWQSVIIRLTDETGNTTYTAPQPRNITLIWADTANGPEVYRESFVIGDTNGQDPDIFFTTYQTAVKDQFLKIVFNFTTRPNLLTWRVTGSYKTVVDPSYQYKSAYMPPHIADPLNGDVTFGEDDSGTSRIVGVCTWTGMLQNNVGYSYYPSVISGAAAVSHSIEGPGGVPIPAGGSLDAWVKALSEYSTTAAIPNLYMLKTYTGTLPYFNAVEIKLPFAPLLIFLRYTNGTAGTFQANVNLAIGIER